MVNYELKPLLYWRKWWLIVTFVHHELNKGKNL